jgi:hypothetical protein
MGSIFLIEREITNLRLNFATGEITDCIVVKKKHNFFFKRLEFICHLYFLGRKCGFSARNLG